MLQAPDAAVFAFESLLDNEDPWVRALARMHVGKMRIMLGQGGRDAEANLEMALAEFRALGERFGISLALSVLADQLAMRGEFAVACEYDEQAIAVVTEVGAIEDVIELRTHQAEGSPIRTGVGTGTGRLGGRTGSHRCLLRRRDSVRRRRSPPPPPPSVRRVRLQS
jgi:hypothetical protein